MELIKILIGLFLFTSISFGQNAQQLKHLDSYFNKSLQEWNIPGMAIAIVNKDSIVFSKGYGFANIEKKLKVDENTLFALASNSKAFTATSIAKLVEQGRLKWTDKVIDYLPYFKMYNDYVTNHFTIEDLLCHRSGLPTFSGDLLWFGTTKTPEEIINSQQYLTPKTEFRTTFGYSNIAFLAAGQIIEKVTGEDWSTYIQKSFLNPLQMDRTLTSTNQLNKTDNIATPYYYENGKNNELKWLNWDNIAPAGALISSVNDFSKWLQLNINKGKLNDKEYFSENSFETITTPHINIPFPSKNENVHFKSYGLGWYIQDYYGAKVVSHGGGYDGMISKTFYLPEQGIGVVILTNNLNWLAGILKNKILDVLLTNNLEGKDWSADYYTFKKKQDSIQNIKLIKNNKLRGKLNPNHLKLENYTGIFKDKIYGTVSVSIKNNQLHFSMDKTPIYNADLYHWNNNIFTFRFDKNLTSLPQGKLWFDLNKNGLVSKLHIHVPNPDFDFSEFEFIKQ
ncbi:serine hydrolase [Lutibacter citreus]|uniref:serine hydrolase n=1 Tax=Lutibacter citreus TaxID=2138210 RepID=UPI000DBE510F|nr:serine hydrolase [Lutibacter citreus]